MVKKKLINKLSHRLMLSAAVVLPLFGAVFTASSASAEDVNIQIDQAAPIRLDRPAATILVGNPSIADISAQDNSLLFVMGRTMGTTNIIAIDNRGNTIADVQVHVTAPSSHRVVLHRNVARYTYSCANSCERVVMPGDIYTPEKPVPVYTDMDEANMRKLNLAKEAKEISEN